MSTSNRTFVLACAVLSLSLLTPAGCQQNETAATKEEKEQAKLAKAETKQQNLRQEAEAAMNDLRQSDPSIDSVLQRAYGYAVFPSVAKGGFIVGGAHGKGIVYERGRAVGEADLTQASVGFLAGGQAFRELIVFQTAEAMEKFRNGQMSLGADIGAVALKSGAAASTQFKDGVAVFVKPVGGAMFEASVAGQKFTFKPMR
jgi:lipid-binding SYLF domain-containing protein